MSVKFGVVGIFYNTTVDLTQVGGNTVGDIIQYLYRKDPGFFYTSIDADGNRIISMLGFRHDQPFKGRTGIDYPKGFYGLTQSFTTPTPNPYSVWQYYLADASGKRQPTQADESYTRAVVQDGWSIVWRLVTILNGPGNLAKRLKKLDPQLVSQLAGVP